MALRTIVLKLYKPSARKREIIDKAMYSYSRAYQYLLDRAATDIDHIEKEFRDEAGRYRASRIAKWIDRDIGRELNQFGIEPFKDSLKMDFSMTMSGYLSLKKIQADTGYPVAYLSWSRWEGEFNELINKYDKGAICEVEFEKEALKLSKKAEALKPLFFCRSDTKRDYCLLYDEEKDRYYAKLYLMNVKSSDRQVVQAIGSKELRYIHKNGGMLEYTGKKERYILVPLAFGKWQESYLRKALESPGMIKTARLIKRDNEYFLSINIDIGEKERIKTSTYLGLARGLKSIVSYSVVDEEGQAASENSVGLSVDIEQNLINAGECSKTMDKIPDNLIHKLANRIVDIADEFKAQVIVEALLDKGDKLQWIGEDGQRWTPKLTCSRYNRLVEMLSYKLPERGLPPPVRVSPVGVFYSCPCCGLRSKDNRFSMDMFICIACGAAMDIERAGSLNLARKLVTYRKDALKVRAFKTPEGVKFINEDIGLEFNPSSPEECMEEFKGEIQRIIKDFYENMTNGIKDRNFKKKYSLIKKLEQSSNIINLIQII